MAEYTGKTNDVAKAEEPAPAVGATTSGITSPMQLVDSTSTVKFVDDSTDASHIPR